MFNFRACPPARVDVPEVWEGLGVSGAVQGIRIKDQKVLLHGQAQKQSQTTHDINLGESSFNCPLEFFQVAGVN